MLILLFSSSLLLFFSSSLLLFFFFSSSFLPFFFSSLLLFFSSSLLLFFSSSLLLNTFTRLSICLPKIRRLQKFPRLLVAWRNVLSSICPPIELIVFLMRLARCTVCKKCMFFMGKYPVIIYISTSVPSLSLSQTLLLENIFFTTCS